MINFWNIILSNQSLPWENGTLDGNENGAPY
jgi:hypothetical protein